MLGVTELTKGQPEIGQDAHRMSDCVNAWCHGQTVEALVDAQGLLVQCPHNRGINCGAGGICGMGISPLFEIVARREESQK